VFLAESITDFYVKNIKKSEINVFYNEKNDLNLKKFWDTYFLLKEKYYSLD
jgi:transcriptional regulator